MSEPTIFSIAPKELSCLVGSLFAELEPPCAAPEITGALTLCGRTAQGKEAILIIYPTHCEFIGDSAELETLHMAHCPDRRCKHGSREGISAGQ